MSVSVRVCFCLRNLYENCRMRCYLFAYGSRVNQAVLKSLVVSVIARIRRVVRKKSFLDKCNTNLLGVQRCFTVILIIDNFSLLHHFSCPLHNCGEWGRTLSIFPECSCLFWHQELPNGPSTVMATEKNLVKHISGGILSLPLSLITIGHLPTPSSRAFYRNRFL